MPLDADTRRRVRRLTYEDKESGPDKLSLLLDNYDFRLSDTSTFATGNVLVFQYGYVDGVMSAPRTAVITGHSGLTELTVEARGKEYLLNTIRRTRLWRNVRHSDVARELAAENGFPSDAQFIEDSRVYHEQVTQAAMTDGQLLRDMARRNGFEFYIDTAGWHFHKRDLGQRPLRKLTYFTDPGFGDFLKPPTIKGDVTQLPGSVTLRGIDPMTKKVIDVKADNASTQGRAGLGADVQADASGDKASGAAAPAVGFQPVTRAGAMGEIQAGVPTDKRVAQDHVAPTTAATPADAQKRANAVFEKKSQGALTLAGEIVGDPLFVAKSVVEIAGLGRVSGRFYTTSVKAVWDTQAVTTFESRRDSRAIPSASAQAPKSKATINDQKAPETTSADGSAEGSSELEEYQGVSRDGRTSETRYVEKGGKNR